MKNLSPVRFGRTFFVPGPIMAMCVHISENNRFSAVLADALNYDPLTNPVLDESASTFLNRGWSQSTLV